MTFVEMVLPGDLLQVKLKHIGMWDGNLISIETSDEQGEPIAPSYSAKGLAGLMIKSLLLEESIALHQMPKHVAYMALAKKMMLLLVDLCMKYKMSMRNASRW